MDICNNYKNDVACIEETVKAWIKYRFTQGNLTECLKFLDDVMAKKTR